MSLLSQLFNKLFRKPKQTDPPDISKKQNSAFDNWRSKEKENIIAAEQRLKHWIVDKIQSNGSLDFTWESGNDEAFLEFPAYSEADKDKFEDLEMYLTYKLDIPDAGEFEMTGTGKLYIQNNTVVADYRSELREMIDFDEETDEAVYGEAEKENNRKELFVF